MRARAAAWLEGRSRRELALYGALMAIAALLRTIDLADRPFHHDESQDAYFSWVFFDRGDYAYDPLLHGPLRFYLTAAMYALFGDSDFTARLAPALMGTLIVGLPYLLRRQIGRPAALAAAALLVFTPTYLYFSRFAREDIYIACINLALVVAVFRYLDRPSRGGPIAIGVLTALAFATKETTFITLFVAGSFLMVAVPLQGVRARRGGGSWRDGDIARRLSAVGWEPWGYGLVAFWLVFALLFTVFLTNPGGLWDGIYDGLAYWLGQHDVRRGGEPWYFHIVLLVAHEWPVVLLGAVGAFAVLRRPTILGVFLIWAFFVSLVVYSWAGEKFSWLAMHPLLPLLLLAGIGISFLVAERRGAGRAIGGAVVAVCLAYSLYATYTANALNRADPREFLVSTQTSEDVPVVVERILALDDRVRRRTGRGVQILIDDNQGHSYPWAWYFRHLDVGFDDLGEVGYVPRAQVLLLTDESRREMLPLLAAYEGQRFRFRVWWVRDWGRLFDAEAWLHWYADRRPWNPIGGMPSWVYVRRDAAAS